MNISSRAGVSVVVLSLVATPVVAQVSVVTQHNDVARTGANLDETLLTTANVNVSSFGKLFERSVDDQIYGQPLYVANVTLPGWGTRNIVYVATVNDTVYAFDADDPAAAAPLWSVSYINPANGIVPVSRTQVGQACGTYLDFSGNIGIISTPVIDVPSQTMYLVVRTTENGVFKQRLHAIDIRDHSERAGSPVDLTATIPGTGDGHDAQNHITFNAQTQNQRAALLLANNTVYIAWASHCDQGPYHGWILGYNQATLQQTVVYNTTPNGGLGGIWQSGQGLSTDASGNIYAVTGNGSFNGTSANPSNFGNTFLKLSPAGTLLDWFTPYNWSALNSSDLDLGLQGAMLLPNTNLVVAGGKQGKFYVLNRDNMGHFHSGGDTQIVQSFSAVSNGGEMNASPVYWNGPTGPVMYLWPAGDPLKIFRFTNGLFQTTPMSQSSVLAPNGNAGGMMSLSANGSAAGTGILWATHSAGGDPNQQVVPGIIRAFDASDATRELWNSGQNAGRDGLGSFSKFSSPTIANGKVYVSTFSNKLVAYGLLTGGNQPPVAYAGTDQTITLPAAASLAGAASDDGLPSGTLATTWSQVSGPGAATFSTPSALGTSVSFSAAGIYTLRFTAFDGSLTTTDDVKVTVNPAPGTGLVGQYFNDSGNGAHFTTLALTRTDATVNFSWGTGAPAPGVQSNNFSVRWTGQVLAPVTGNYQFRTKANDGVRLWVNGHQLINAWTDVGSSSTNTVTSANIALVAGTKYAVTLEYYDHTSSASSVLQWGYPGKSMQVIPQIQLFP